MKYKYIPRDLAIFFIKADLSISEQRMVINDLWLSHNEMIWYKHRENKELFIRNIYYEVSKRHGDDDSDEINIILNDIGSGYYIDGEINEYDVLYSYFKVIKLYLTYVDGCYYKLIKLRNLLGIFGYKRRTANLIDCIRKTLTALSLKIYLRGGIPCDIADVNLDNVVIIRLAN